jgi:hypothetical protein
METVAGNKRELRTLYIVLTYGANIEVNLITSMSVAGSLLCVSTYFTDKYSDNIEHSIAHLFLPQPPLGL